MHRLFRNKLWLAASLLAALSLVVGTVFAHEGREVGEYRFVVGWAEEPAYEGMKNGVELQVTKLAEAHPHEGEDEKTSEGDSHEDGEDGHDEDGEGHEDEGDGHDEDEARQSMLPPSAPKIMASGLPQYGSHEEAPVEGLQDTLQVEVTHPATGDSRVFDLRADVDEPGRYIADLIPTAPGVYEFRVFGMVEDNPTDEVFVSRGVGGDFDDVQTATALQFPHQMTEMRELESAVRGAMETAQLAQDAALEADSGSPGLILGIIGAVLGAVGLAAGATALLVARRRAPAEE